MPIYLDTTAKKIEAVLAGAITTNQLPIVASYGQVGTGNFAVVSYVEADTQTNSATAVTVVPSPPGGSQFVIKTLSIQNADTVAAIVTVRMNDSSTLRPIQVKSLNAGQSLHYEDGNGWYVL